jgi:hypothetical protein
VEQARDELLPVDQPPLPEPEAQQRAQALDRPVEPLVATQRGKRQEPAQQREGEAQRSRQDS